MSLFRTLAPLRALARPHLAAASAGGVASSVKSRGYSASLGAEEEEGEFAPVPEEFVPAEPLFMTTLTFSEHGIQAMLKKNINREKSVAKLIASLGGRLESYFVTMTGGSSAVMTYTFPKNHDVQTLVYTLMASGSYKDVSTTKLMKWSDAAVSIAASRKLYASGVVSCNISLEVDAK
eukprot:CAMPEP_0197575056 /NCGR_PEP_ID=MMETSP1326-20131121/591_1 /TAXON_ID=1155430 /ORGANISM="Genus nov. species nov., Strain RCC2288" /LENGTH=177 /DNA_ID=CAMNT_0043137755 /DNA_START=33 /DNA_END=566 /DNA_ORIENTATION=+